MKEKEEEIKMKRFISVLLALVMVLSLCSCGGSEAPADTGNAEQSTETPKQDASKEVEDAENSTIEVDEGLLTVEVTLPATFFEEESEDDIKAAAKENGFSYCTVHEDGSVTYKMSKAKHKEMMNEMKASLDETIEELINGEEAVASFQKIEYADDFSRFDVYVDPETYTDWDSLYVLVFYMSGAYYQAFDGKDMNDVDVVVNFINNVTNETVNSGSFRDWADNAESAG